MAVRAVFALVALAYVLSHFAGHAHAQSSLGIGTNEAIVPSGGLFASWIQWINVHQQAFYRSLTGAMKGMRDDTGALWPVVGLSFAYGIFHAAGPGHGKAVISSYMLANEVALRRGILLSFVSALLQAATAIVVIALAYFVLRGTAVRMTDATWFLEIASYGLITLFGAWLLWRKAAPLVRDSLGVRPASALSAQATPSGSALSSDACRPGRLNHPDAVGLRIDDRAELCISCGRSHAPDPSLLAGDNFNWKAAWSAIATVGLRPCSGALIVLTFALLNGLWLGGILSVLAMALGTAITVSVLATLAVTAKNWAVAFAGDGRTGNRVHAGIEIAGAAFVMVLGLMLLTASLYPVTGMPAMTGG